jgi:hypothetical protein
VAWPADGRVQAGARLERETKAARRDSGRVDVTGPLYTLRKHWVLTSSLVLLTLVAAVGAWVGTSGPYQSESQVVFLASQQASKLNGNNPYLSFQDSLNMTGDIVRQGVMDPRVVAALAAKGFKDAYIVQDDPLSAGPVLDIIATGHSKAGVMATQAAVTADVQSQLQQLQSDVLPKNQITSKVISSSLQPTLLITKKARPVVAVLFLGVLLILVIPQIVEAVQNRYWNRRRKGQRPWAPIETAPSPPSSGDGSRSSQLTPTAGQLTPTVGQRPETNGKAAPEAANRQEPTSSMIDF